MLQQFLIVGYSLLVLFFPVCLVGICLRSHCRGGITEREGHEGNYHHCLCSRRFALFPHFLLNIHDGCHCSIESLAHVALCVTWRIALELALVDGSYELVYCLLGHLTFSEPLLYVLA